MKQRQVSIELLRIIAMLMVLILHANFMGIGKPTAETVLTTDGIIRTILQSFCICAVDTFVMISGWFGIRPSFRGFANFMWQVFYFVGLAYLTFHIVDGKPITSKDFLSCFGLYNGGGWFVASYIGLYIISPILNAYLESSRPRTITLLLITFILFELLWGNTLSVGFVIGGYSTFSFIGIYILAGLLRKWQIKIGSKLSLLLFFLCGTINGIRYVISIRYGLVAVSPMLFNYINPLVIASATFLVLAFANKPDIKGIYLQKFILWTASSCFAAYLLHVGTSDSLSTYIEYIRQIRTGYSQDFGYLLVMLFIIAVFLCAVLLDQPRKLVWQYIISPVIIKYNK